MSTIADKLTQLNTIKGDIKTAINNKGGNVDDDFSTYATAINNLSTGSGETVSSYWPGFFELRTLKGTNYEYGDYLFMNTYIKDENDKNLIENLDVSNMTSMSYMFNKLGFNKSNVIKDLDLTKWNVSRNGNFFYMFSSVYLNSINISGWNFSKVTTISNMFNSFRGNIINMSNCNTSTIKDFSGLYSYSYVASIDMTGCDTSNATNMNQLFSGCANLVTVIGSLDLSNLTNGFYSASYYNPVSSCKKLETLYLKNIYKNCTMTNNSKWCINLGDTKIKSECLISIISELPDLINDKGLTTTDKIILTLPPTNKLTAEQVQPAIDKGWTVANTTY